jgi:hypothetical protein
MRRWTLRWSVMFKVTRRLSHIFRLFAVFQLHFQKFRGDLVKCNQFEPNSQGTLKLFVCLKFVGGGVEVQGRGGGGQETISPMAALSEFSAARSEHWSLEGTTAAARMLHCCMECICLNLPRNTVGTQGGGRQYAWAAGSQP